MGIQNLNNRLLNNETAKTVLVYEQKNINVFTCKVSVICRHRIRFSLNFDFENPTKILVKDQHSKRKLFSNST